MISLGESLLVLVALGAFLKLWTSRKRLPLPPGPKPLPIVGNYFQLPAEYEYKTYAEWGKKYGPIMHVNVFGRHLIIINSLKIANDLLEKRSNIYSNRPIFRMAGDLIGWDRAVALGQSGERHRKYRKFLHSTISKTAAREFWPIQEAEARGLLHRFLESPEDFADHIKRAVAASIVRISYGHQIETDNDPFLSMAQKVQDVFSETTLSNSYVVEWIPALKHIPDWFPGAKFKRDAKEWRKDVYHVLQWPFDKVKIEMEAGTAAPSYVSNLLNSEHGKDEDSIKWSALSLYTGGADTTVSSITTFCIAMARYPEHQKRAQAEIDEVIGSERLPSFADRENLPFVNAIVKEVLRWVPVTPLSVPHRVSQDDEYEGYHIPAGATILSNIWAMHHDETVWKDPEVFNPDRHFESKLDPFTYNFGFGRRICPGMWTADYSLYIATASILATFNIAKMPGEELNPEYYPGLITHPKPFKIQITPRNERAAELIRESQ